MNYDDILKVIGQLYLETRLAITQLQRENVELKAKLEGKEK